ncbi:pentatricopeptide repeat-containing protein [Prunus yedoensis var. nudiflora]|uniref:Pentatricopeptide repeat-containing protein n=1 Tax=Prunus yedoensis var. nudiflora TaxID=2094558 RepID=A0A314ZIB3_PRUYE|nr:pentatricopeptide repeat-containing protein [Prunus yedoensis var. nudiflora]
MARLVISIKYCSSQSETCKQDEDTVREISTILKHNDWHFALNSSDLPKKLNPHVVRAVLQQNHQVGDPKRLLSFFIWTDTHIGVPQNLHSFSILAVALCNSKLFEQAHAVLERMVKSRKPPLEVVNSLVMCFREFDGSDRVGF